MERTKLMLLFVLAIAVTYHVAYILRPKCSNNNLKGVDHSVEYKITMTIANYARSKNVKRILNRIKNYDIVDEIIVWDNSLDPNQAIVFNHSKVSIVRQPMETWGMLGRFKIALMARNDLVLVHDDDLIVHESAIEKLVRAKCANFDRIICYYGREASNVNTGTNIGYKMEEVFAPAYVPICLPRLMLTDRRFLLQAVRYAPIIEDLGLRGRPYWNGEDIWHSLTAINATKNLNLVIPIDDGDITQLPAPNAISGQKKIRGRGFDHVRHRDMFTREASLRIGLTAKDMYVQPYDGII